MNMFNLGQVMIGPFGMLIRSRKMKSFAPVILARQSSQYECNNLAELGRTCSQRWRFGGVYASTKVMLRVKKQTDKVSGGKIERICHLKSISCALHVVSSMFISSAGTDKISK